MAVTFRGFDSASFQFDEAYWAKYQRILGALAGPHGVTSGLVASAGAGTREVSLSAGEGISPGIYFDSSATETFTLAANAGSVNRFDYLVARANWTANTVTFVVVPGTPALPALTQTPGTQWDVPLAIITVRPGVTVLAAADVQVCKPLPRTARALVLDLPNVVMATDGPVPGVSGVFDNPGWPYRIQAAGFCRIRAAGTSLTDPEPTFEAIFNQVIRAGGFVVVEVRVNNVIVGRAITANLAHGPAPVAFSGLSAVLTGPAEVTVHVTPISFPSFQALELVGTVDQLALLQVPA